MSSFATEKPYERRRKAASMKSCLDVMTCWNTNQRILISSDLLLIAPFFPPKTARSALKISVSMKNYLGSIKKDQQDNP